MRNKEMIERRAEMLVEVGDLERQGVRSAKIVKHMVSKYGITERTVYGLLADVRKSAPDGIEGMAVKKKSILYDAEGGIKQQWVKFESDNSVDAVKVIVEELCRELPKYPKSKPVKLAQVDDDLLACYPMGDPHFGMLAWNEETEGGDFDLKIAEDDLCDAVDRLVALGRGKHALIVNLGDFFHADNMDARTWRSGHPLDTDSRWLKMLRTGIRAMIRCIQSALLKHEKVTVICAIGNHDDHSSMMLMTVLSNIFENEPRVEILDKPTVKHYHQFGKVLIGVHHGHTIKMADLPLQMAIDRAKEWHESPYRYWFTGHIHHDSRKEIGGVLVESFRTLAAADSYGASKGYVRTGRDMKCIVMHKDFGEIERHTVSVEMIGQIRRLQRENTRNENKDTHHQKGGHRKKKRN